MMRVCVHEDETWPTMLANIGYNVIWSHSAEGQPCASFSGDHHEPLCTHQSLALNPFVRHAPTGYAHEYGSWPTMLANMDYNAMGSHSAEGQPYASFSGDPHEPLCTHQSLVLNPFVRHAPTGYAPANRFSGTANAFALPPTQAFTHGTEGSIG